MRLGRSARTPSTGSREVLSLARPHQSRSSSVRLLPLTALGGIFFRPQVRTIAEAGPEAVVPLSRYRGQGGTVINLTINGPIMGADVERTVHDALRNITRKDGAVPGVRVSG